MNIYPKHLITACLLAGSLTLQANTTIQETTVPTTVLSYSSPEVPTSVAFCGKTIDLTRFDRHERMDRELLAFTYMHSTSIQLIKRANRYFPIVEPILKEHGIPDDFKYLQLQSIGTFYGRSHRSLAIHAEHSKRIRAGGQQEH